MEYTGETDRQTRIDVQTDGQTEGRGSEWFMLCCQKEGMRVKRDEQGRGEGRRTEKSEMSEKRRRGEGYEQQSKYDENFK